MHIISKSIRALIILVILLGMLGPAAPNPASSPPRMHPLLAQIAAQSPDQQVSVIVQKRGATDRAERLVAALGGVVTKDLAIINAFSAELPASAAFSLSRLAAVRWNSVSWNSVFWDD